MRRHPRKLLSVLAVTLGIVVTTTVATIALDVGDRVSRELRSFGANISVTPAADSLPVAVGGVEYKPQGTGDTFLAEADLVKLKRIFWRNNIVAFAPFLDVPVTVRGRPAVLIGSWFEKAIKVDKVEVFRTGLKSLHPAWKVQGQWPSDQGPAGWLVGERLARALDLRLGRTIAVGVAAGSSQASSSRAALKGKPTTELPVLGILETGGPEDDQLFAPLEVVQNLAGLSGKTRRVEVSALTKPEDAFARSDVTKLGPEDFERWYCSPYVSSIAYQIQQAIPGAAAQPVYQVAETEGKILGRVGVLMAILTAAALITAVLAVASMMLANVLERRVEIGLFKSLGATDTRVLMIFLIEACFIGLVGGVAGYFGGSLLAGRLSVAVFGRPTSAHWIILPSAIALALIVALVGSALPLRRGLKFSPALVLRN